MQNDVEFVKKNNIDLMYTTYIVFFFLLSFHFELCFHEENVLLILFNAHIRLI